MRKFRDYSILTLKGLGMGASDIIPGVSGGTIAFITGIYEELINSIKSINIEAFKLLFTFKIRELWQHVNGNFLLAVFAGIFISIFSLSKLLEFLLLTYPVFIWSFFFGLILASSVMILRGIKAWDFKLVISLITGILMAYLITSITPAETSDAYWFVFLSGAIAICAMILPGISGSFILLLLGKYQYILNAVNTLKIDVLLIFMAGAAIGIISFSNLLSWLLQRYHNLTVVLLAGFMLGSLNKIWPWKEVISTFTDRHGEIQPLVEKNILPSFSNSSDGILYAIIFAFIGIALIVIIELLSRKTTK